MISTPLLDAYAATNPAALAELTALKLAAGQPTTPAPTPPPVVAQPVPAPGRVIAVDFDWNITPGNFIYETHGLGISDQSQLRASFTAPDRRGMEVHVAELGGRGPSRYISVGTAPGADNLYAKKSGPPTNTVRFNAPAGVKVWITVENVSTAGAVTGDLKLEFGKGGPPFDWIKP